MRWRVGVVLCFFAAYFGIGCREPLKPNVDRNQAPETWITAAPFDTITVRDSQGNPIGDPTPGTIPVRFHIYWAGADKDGQVVGYYWAVVETLPRPQPGLGLPRLPGPKPQDYHFTTRTDSTFVFSVAEDIPDRQHAFFVYAVDNQGKPDPTPARFIFNANDRFPPIPIFDTCSCSGTVYFFDGAGVLVSHPDSSVITDQENRFTAARDTCPSNSTLTFRWHGEPSAAQVAVTGFRYKLDEPQFVEVGPDVHVKQYLTHVGADTIPPSSGEKIFTLRVVDQAFGTRDSTRRFQYNYAPDTWLSGPDPNSLAFSTKPNGERYALLESAQKGSAGIAGSLLSPDSTLILPALRPKERTFFEIWEDTLFVRTDGDTVHMNCWVLFHSGGFDRDSKYSVAVSSLARQLPNFPGGPVLEPAGPNGSPTQFRVQTLTQLWPTNALAVSSISNPYPLFDPNNTFNNEVIGGYEPMTQSGLAYAYTFAVDGDNSPDKRVSTEGVGSIDPLTQVRKVAAGTATPYERELRKKVLSFYVDKAPYLVTDSPLFFPRLSVRDTFTTPTWDLRLVGADEDPFLKLAPPGGPVQTTTLRRRITFLGTDLNTGGPLEALDPTTYLNQSDISVSVPQNLAPGPVTLRVEICDCDLCEDNPGIGRCRTTDIPVFYKPSSPARPASLQSIPSSRPGTGVSPLRSKRP